MTAGVTTRRYVIIGAGAVGATLAVRLREAGRDVVLVARGAQLAALRRGPLTLRTPTSDHTVSLPPAGGPDDVDLLPTDVLVLAVKAHQAQAVLATWAARPVAGLDRFAGEVIPIVTVQNGLATETAALRGFATVIGASIWVPATFDRPGEVLVYAQAPTGLIWLGRHPGGVDSIVTGVAGDLHAADFGVQTVTDIPRWKAAKLISNVSNAVDVFTATPRDRRAVTEALESEARAAFAAAGIEVADTRSESALDTTTFATAPIADAQPSRRSTWQSLARRADGVETDHLNGEIVLLGRLHGVATPVNGAITTAITRLVTSGATPGTIPLSAVVDLGRLGVTA